MCQSQAKTNVGLETFMLVLFISAFTLWTNAKWFPATTRQHKTFSLL